MKSASGGFDGTAHATWSTSGDRMTKPLERRLQRQPSSLKALLTAGALLLGGALAVFGGSGMFLASGGGEDVSLSADAVAARAAQFAAAGPIEATPVPAAETQSAVAALKLPAADASRLQQELVAGTSRLIYVTLWDDVAVDGDVVRLSSNGLSIDLSLSHQPTRVAIPAPPQGVVNLTGVRDGGGGITVAVMSGSEHVPLPPMSPGQKIGIPVRVP